MTPQVFTATSLKVAVIRDVAPCSQILTDVSEELTAPSVTLIMEAVSSSGKSVAIY